MLAPFRVIGWDIDNTLIGNRNSPLMHRYIRENRQKTHYLITFRTGEWVNEVYGELFDRYGGNAPTQRHFAGIFSVPDQTFQQCHHALRMQRYGLSFDQNAIDEYIGWKGKICGENGIEVLIDDNAAHVLPGCHQHGVTYLDPESFA